MRKKLIIVSGPSGSGKTTLVKHLLSACKSPLAFSISATSRQPRANETDGVDYYFLSPELFQKKIADGDFLEYEEVYNGSFYGTLKEEVQRLWNEGKNVVFDIDVAGALTIKKQFPKESITILIRPKDIETLRERLEERASDSSKSIEERVSKAEYELQQAPLFDSVIDNDVLEVSTNQLLEKVNSFLS